MLDNTNNRQRGDVEKGERVIVHILTQCDGKKIPVRVAFGSDAPSSIISKCKETENLLNELLDTTITTDHVD
jgi:hypothetical protein